MRLLGYMIESTVLINRTQLTQFGGACPGVSDLRRLVQTAGSVGVMDRVPYVRLVECAAPGVAPKPFQNKESLAAAVETGDLVASVQGELSAKYYLSRQPQASIRLQLCDVPDTRPPTAAPAKPGSPPISPGTSFRLSDLRPSTARGVGSAPFAKEGGGVPRRLGGPLSHGGAKR